VENWSSANQQSMVEWNYQSFFLLAQRGAISADADRLPGG
jgi:hypothetical protein